MPFDLAVICTLAPHLTTGRTEIVIEKMNALRHGGEPD